MQKRLVQDATNLQKDFAKYMFLKREKQIFRALFCRFNKLDGKLVVK